MPTLERSQMWESSYWKEELARIAKTIRPKASPKRYSDRAVSVVERDVIIGFFIVRRLIELHKVSTAVSKMKLDVFSATPRKTVTKINFHRIDENYDWDKLKKEKKLAPYICNQAIHAYFSAVERGPDRNWSSLILASDFDRNKVAWQVPFSSIILLFETAANDYPSTASMEFDDVKQDFKVTTN
jgi:hypothetical protein